MLHDKYTDLLKQAQELAPKDSACAEYLAYLAELRADGKPFNEKETAFLTAYVADTKTPCPKPPSKLRQVFAFAVLLIPVGLAIAVNTGKPRKLKAA